MRSEAEFSRSMRRIILDQSKRANVGHIGSALSIVDILTAVYGGNMANFEPREPDRDRFVLSKGHAALALYAALHLSGWVTAQQLNSYCDDNSLLGVHPEAGLSGIDFTTGSLGHGLSMAAGAALAARMQGSKRRVFVLVSDAECNEGSLWEAVMFAAHHRLSNLIAIVDADGQQALGYTKDVMDLSPIGSRFGAFGWDHRELDGHNADEIRGTLQGFDTKDGPPHVIVANTVFGKGVSFMEGQIKWHYLPLSDEEHSRALEEVSAAV